MQHIPLPPLSLEEEILERLGSSSSSSPPSPDASTPVSTSHSPSSLSSASAPAPASVGEHDQPDARAQAAASTAEELVRKAFVAAPASFPLVLERLRTHQLLSVEGLAELHLALLALEGQLPATDLKYVARAILKGSVSDLLKDLAPVASGSLQQAAKNAFDSRLKAPSDQVLLKCITAAAQEFCNTVRRTAPELDPAQDPLPAIAQHIVFRGVEQGTRTSGTPPSEYLFYKCQVDCVFCGAAMTYQFETKLLGQGEWHIVGGNHNVHYREHCSAWTPVFQKLKVNPKQCKKRASAADSPRSSASQRKRRASGATPAPAPTAASPPPPPPPPATFAADAVPAPAPAATAAAAAAAAASSAAPSTSHAARLPTGTGSRSRF
jgi:hypothetical protein